VTARRHDEKAIILTGQEAAFIKDALSRCYGTLKWACWSSPVARAAAQDAARAAGEGCTVDSVLGDACLAIDYIDFAAPARRAR
jgi:hypothetical protein